MVTAIFLRSDATEYQNSGYQQHSSLQSNQQLHGYRQAMSQALAAVTIDQSQFVDQPAGAFQREVDAAAARFEGVLGNHGARELIVNDNISPELKGWAVASIATDPEFTAANLAGGWESDLVSRTLSQPVLQTYLDRGTEPQQLQGEALRNTIGQALRVTPDRAPESFATAQQEQAFLNAGLNYQYYGENAQIDGIAERITQLGGDNAAVTIMPVTVTNNEFGVHTFSVFKVEGDNGTFYIEDVNPGRHYSSLGDWQENSQLPPGKMSYAQGLDWNDGNVTIATENTALVTDSFGEWARKVGDGAALVVGLGVGAAIIVGTGGTALLAFGAGAGIYGYARAGEQLYDAHVHGQDVSDLSDAEIRGLWLDAAAGTLSFGAAGAARGATKLLSTGSRLAPAATSVAAGLQLSASVTDLASGTNQVAALATQWDSMSTSERAMGLLNTAFWAGGTLKSAHTTDGFVADDFSFTRLRNNIEFGTPYAQVRNSDLQEGQMRVTYDTRVNGRATNIRIEMGGTGSDQASLALHVSAARQMEASGGLRDQLSSIVGGERPLPVGSAGWEARLEISKIEAEQAQVREAISAPSISQSQRQEHQSRLEELDNAISLQRERLDQLAFKGEGWVASPSTGAMQASALGYADAPSGWHWVAGTDGVPGVRNSRSNPSDERLYYDSTTGTFSTTKNIQPTERVGHGPNDIRWEVNANGEPIRVTGILRELYRHAQRSSEELSAQNIRGEQGLPGDHAGHVLGHRFVLDQGLKNLFPQDANFNLSAYRTLENEMADWVAAGVDVHVDIKLSNYVDGRPGTVEVKFTPMGADSLPAAEAKVVEFSNDSNQSFERTSNADIRTTVNAATQNRQSN